MGNILYKQAIGKGGLWESLLFQEVNQMEKRSKLKLGKTMT